MNVNRDAILPIAPPRESLRRRAVRRLLRAQTLYTVMLAAFAVLALFAHLNKYFAWDLKAAHWLQSLKIPWLFNLMVFVSIFGNRWIPWAIATLTVIAFLVFRKRSEAFALVLSAGGGQLLNFLIKTLVGRPRPTHDLVRVHRDIPTQSFPSGHVTFYVCYFGFLFFVAYALLPINATARRLVLALIALPVMLVGFSRVYLGAHWPSDTLGAYALSGVWLAFSLQMYRIWKERATFHPELQQDSKELTTEAGETEEIT